MKKTLLSLFVFMASLTILGQGKPLWTWASEREDNYPQKFFFTGYIEGNVRVGESIDQAKNRLQKDAQALLSEEIRVTVKSQTVSQTVSTTTNQTERLDSKFMSNVQTVTVVEIAGMHSELPYYDKETGIVFAFAYVNKEELANYYKGNLNMNLLQAEGLLKTAQDLEIAAEKVKALQQCEAVKPLLDRVRSAQDMLIVIDVNTSFDGLQQIKTESLHNLLIQMLARLAQGVYVYVEGNEDLFNTKVNIVENQLKAKLAENGCSFVETPECADFKLKINVSTRHSSYDDGIVFCFADAQVELYNIHKQKLVYRNEIAQKGGGSSQDRAGRKAMTDVVPKILEKLKPWIEK